MSNQDKIDKLTVALHNIIEVQETMDPRFKICVQCGCHKHDNFEEYESRKQLGACVHRIERAIRCFQGGKEHGRETSTTGNHVS